MTTICLNSGSQKYFGRSCPHCVCRDCGQPGRYVQQCPMMMVAILFTLAIYIYSQLLQFATFTCRVFQPSGQRSECERSPKDGDV